MLLTICSTTTNIILCCHNTCVFLNSCLADHVLTLEMTFQSMAATATHQKSARLWCYSYQPIMSARGTRPHVRGVAKNSLYLFVTESQRRYRYVARARIFLLGEISHCLTFQLSTLVGSFPILVVIYA